MCDIALHQSPDFSFCPGKDLHISASVVVETEGAGLEG